MGGNSSKEVSEKPVVVIVGGGYGGVTLAKALDAGAHWNVVLIDRKTHFVHNMASVRSVTEEGYEKEILIPYSNLLKYGSVVQGEVTDVSDVSLSIHGHDEPIKFDYLVIATGSSYAFPGKLPEATYEKAVDKYKEAQVACKAAEKITIIGGGPVGVELAGEIATDYPEKQVTLVHSNNLLCGRPDGSVNAEFSAKVLKTLEKLKVKVLLDEKVLLEENKTDMLERQKQEAVAKEDFVEANRLKAALEASILANDPAKNQINIRDDIPVNYAQGKRTLQTRKGLKIETDMVYFCMGMQLNNGSLQHFKNKMNRGRLEVDENLRVAGENNIFAIGDIANKNVPMGYYAQEQAKWLAGYMNKSIRQGKSAKPFPEQKTAVIVSIGRLHGVTQLPLNKNGKVFGSTVSKMIKSKDMFTDANWAALNMDRKTKQIKKDVGGDEDKQLISLAKAMTISEGQAAIFKEGKMPEMEERETAYHA